MEEQVYVLTLITVSPPSTKIVRFLVRNMQFLFISWCLTEIQNFLWNRQWVCLTWLYVWNWKHDRYLDINIITILNFPLFAKVLVKYSPLFMEAIGGIYLGKTLEIMFFKYIGKLKFCLGFSSPVLGLLWHHRQQYLLVLQNQQ